MHISLNDEMFNDKDLTQAFDVLIKINIINIYVLIRINNGENDRADIPSRQAPLELAWCD